MSVENAERSVWPSSGRNVEKIARIYDKILQDHLQTISDLCQALGLFSSMFGNCQRF